MHTVNEQSSVPATSIKAILDASSAGQTVEALELTSTLLREHPDCPYLLVLHAILIQVQDPVGDYTLQEAEVSLIRAHATDKNYLPALEELAHYYDAVRPDPGKARMFASTYLEKSRRILDEMRTIAEGSG